jgi:hypothetical protein
VGGKPSKTVGAYGAHRNRARMLDWQGFDVMQADGLNRGGNPGLRRWCRNPDLSGTATNGMFAFPMLKDLALIWTANGWSRAWKFTGKE